MVFFNGVKKCGSRFKIMVKSKCKKLPFKAIGEKINKSAGYFAIKS